MTCLAMTVLLPLAQYGEYGSRPSGGAGVGIGVLVLPLIVVVAVFAAVRRRSGATRGPTLSLTEFTVDPAATPCIVIAGRPKGLVAWLLTSMGLSPETRLTVTDLQVSITTASLSGEFNNFVPLPHVSSTDCGYSKPFALLVVGVVVFLGSILVGLNGPSGGAAVVVLGLVIAAVCIAIYFTAKRISIQLVTDGGQVLRLTFRPSALNGVPVNIQATVEALALLNSKVLAAA